MCYRLSPFEVVRVNCEMFRESDDAVLAAWEDTHMRMPLHGFSADSVVDVNLKRMFTSNILNYMYMNIQGLLDMFLLDSSLSEFASGTKDGAYLKGGFEYSGWNGRRFDVVKRFRIYDQDSCRATDNYLRVTARVDEYPGPWIVAVVVDMCRIQGGKEVLVESSNR